VKGCRRLNICFSKLPTRAQKTAFLKFSEKLKSTVEEVIVDFQVELLSCFKLQDVLMPLINGATRLRTLDLSKMTMYCQWVLEKHEIKPSIEVFKTGQLLENLQMLKTFPNSRHMEAEFHPNFNFNGLLTSENTVKLKVLSTCSTVSPIFIHLEELRLEYKSVQLLKDFVRVKLPRLTRLKRLEIVVRLRRGDLLDAVELLREMTQWMPTSLQTVERVTVCSSDDPTKKWWTYVDKFFDRSLRRMPPCFLRIDYEGRVIRDSRPNP
jgi:hypothetical protein